MKKSLFFVGIISLGLFVTGLFFAKVNVGGAIQVSDLLCTASTTAYSIGDDAVTTILPERSRRCGFMLTNLSGEYALYSVGGTATAVSGHIVSASTTVSFFDVTNKQAITAMKANVGATTTLLVTEFIY